MGKEKHVKYYVVDAFTGEAFKGNPAAVCLLEEEKQEQWLQSVAVEFNISETCYLTRITTGGSDASSNPVVPKFHLRWFTPVVEVHTADGQMGSVYGTWVTAQVDLCGHATLAASHVLFTNGLVESGVIEFVTLSGILTAKKVPANQNGISEESFLIELNFPVVPTVEFNAVDELAQITKSLGGACIVDIRRTTTWGDLFVVLPSGKAVLELQPQIDEIKECSGGGIIVSGIAPPNSGFDFYSRYFCPKNGVNEDPVCGSAHCALAPYWSEKLGKSDLEAYAASPRTGILNIHVDKHDQRVLLRGKAITVMEGSLLV